MKKIKRNVIKTTIEGEIYDLLIDKKVILSSMRFFGAVDGVIKDELYSYDFSIIVIPDTGNVNILNNKKRNKYNSFFVKYDYIEEETVWVPSEEDEIFIEC